MGKKLSLDDFINRSTKAHGYKYDYSQSDISGGVHKPLKIVCPKHGEFYQSPSEHMRGADCPKCSTERVHDAQRKTQGKFIEQAKKIWGDRFDLSKAHYNGAKEKVCIICPKHGEFWILPGDFLRGHGCPACGGVKRLNTESFIRRAKEMFGDKYTYEHVNYINNGTHVNVTCPIHGDFPITPRNFFNGYGCPKCAQSHLEKSVEVFLSRTNEEYVYQYKPSWAGSFRFDFYIPLYNSIIECQGRQHFSTIDYFKGEYGFSYTTAHDREKAELCRDNEVKIYYLCNKNAVIPDSLSDIYNAQNTFFNIQDLWRSITNSNENAIKINEETLRKIIQESLKRLMFA